MKVICFMMSSINGRIDCAMTELIEGSKEYYELLEKYRFDATISGKITAKMHYALDDKYISKDNISINQPCFYKAIDSKNYSVIMDTKGTLRWDKNTIDGIPMIIALSEEVTQEYLDYLKSLKISYIVSGKNSINLKAILEILNHEFKVNKIGIVGGGKINGAFLKEGLIDDVLLIIGPGIDGRSDQPNVFDGLNDNIPTQLFLKSFRAYPNGVVVLKYSVINKDK